MCVSWLSSLSWTKDSEQQSLLDVLLQPRMALWDLWHNSDKKCIHNPTLEPRKLVTGDVRKGCKLVLAVSFVTAPLPCTLESLSNFKTTAIEILVHIPVSNPPFHNRSVPSWEEQSVWMRDHTVVALVHLKPL